MKIVVLIFQLKLKSGQILRLSDEEESAMCSGGSYGRARATSS